MFIRCKAPILKMFRLAMANGKSRMDLEEQRLRHDIEAREMALKQKVNALKERIEHFKDMADVKSKVQQRPGLMVVGSILAGVLAKKLVSKKHRHSRYADSRPAPVSATVAGRFWDPVIAIISAIVTRAAIGIATEVAGKLVPWKHEKRTNARPTDSGVANDLKR